MIKLDVRYKMLLLLLISIVSFSTKDLYYGSIIFAVVCVISFLIGQPSMVLKHTTVYVCLVAVQLLAAYLPRGLRSFLLMLSIFFHMFMPMLLYAKTFIVSTTVSEMITAMYAMKIPRSLTITLAVALRFFPSAGEELGLIGDAMKLRGIRISAKNLLTRPAIVFEGMMMPMMMRASTIADELSAASITRGIDNPEPRSSYIKLHISAADTALMVLFALMICGVAVAKQLM